MRDESHPDLVTGPSTDARDHAAAALRRLAHAMVAHDADPALLERIARQAGRAREELERGTPRQRPVEDIKRRLWRTRPWTARR